MQLGKQLSNGASRAAGAEFIRLLAGFGSGEAEFPPHPPSASPSLGLAKILAADLFLIINFFICFFQTSILNLCLLCFLWRRNSVYNFKY